MRGDDGSESRFPKRLEESEVLRAGKTEDRLHAESLEGPTQSLGAVHDKSIKGPKGADGVDPPPPRPFFEAASSSRDVSGPSEKGRFGALQKQTEVEVASELSLEVASRGPRRRP